MKSYLIIFIVFFTSKYFAQTSWKSNKYLYSIEIPKGFTKTSAMGDNVDFKANNGINSIVIVVTKLPNQYKENSIFELLGNIEEFGKDWEKGAKEYMNNPKFIKSGKTIINSKQTYWYDYTTENPLLYSKTYQTKNGVLLYTITLTSLLSDYNYFQPTWYKFKEKLKI